MTEVDVAVTDYLLAVESALFAFLLSRQASNRTLGRRSGWRDPFALFFAATGVGSLVGGTVHGFFAAGDATPGVVLWRASLLAVGVAALCGWIIGARMLFGERAARAARLVASLEFLAYAAVIVGVNDSFWVAVANYLPTTAFLIVAFVVAYRSTGDRAAAVGVAGFASTVAAAAIQQFRVAVHPRYFNHNALYHVVQAAALFMIFWAARALAAQKAR